MLGSEQSISGPNIALNTIVAEELCQFADKLEKSKNFNKDLQALLQQTHEGTQTHYFQRQRL